MTILDFMLCYVILTSRHQHFTIKKTSFINLLLVKTQDALHHQCFKTPPISLKIKFRASHFLLHPPRSVINDRSLPVTF